MGSDGFDDDFPRIFGRNEITLRSEIQEYVKKKFISKDKIKAKIEEKEKRYKEISKEKFLNKNETQKVLNAQIAGYKELLEEE